MKSVALVASAVVLSGCSAVGPDYDRPEIDTPDAFRDRDASAVSAAEIARWWDAFGDPELSALVGETLAGNLDLEAAVRRIDAARAAVGIAESDWLPTVDASGGYVRTRPFGIPNVKTQNQWSLGGSVAWELDLFGRIRRSVEAATATLEAEVEDVRGVQVALAAETASAYLELRSLQERLAIARSNVASQEQSQSITAERFRVGMTAGLDPAQADLNLFTTRASIPGLRVGVRRARHRLAVLTGRDPRALDERLAAEGSLPAAPETLMVGIPADLLQNRPDVRAAERRLAAQSASVGVAVAARYPALNLTGSWDWLATDPSGIFDDATETGSVGPLLSVPIFNAGRLRLNVESEEAVLQQLEASLRSQVLVAQEEVENALVAVAQDRLEIDLLGEAARAAERTVDLSLQLYTSGQSDFQDVLQAERSLF
ncbi:MAG: efflux transporter outer membrane subunit, partial [Planctomycetota bacterium]